MDDLILRSLEGPLSDVEHRRLAEWRTAEPEHERRYQELSRLSRLLAAAGPRDGPPRPTVARILERSRGGDPAPFRRWRLLAAAAVMVLAVGAGGYLIGTDRPEPAGFAARELITGPDETSTVRLADGSVVRLAASSRLVIGQEGRREVWLDGTAFFAIAKQAGAPFVVRTRAGSATVLGTRFEMKAGDDRLRVVVVEGRVAVRNDAGQVEVGGGEMTFAEGGAPPAVSRLPDPHQLLGWVGRVLLFNDTPLARAAAEIERRYPITVVIGDSGLAEHLVTGTFPDQPIDQLLATICRIIDARCSITTDTAWIARAR